MMAEVAPREARRPRDRYTFGILLVGIGILMLTDQLEIGPRMGIVLTPGQWWPLILVALGIGQFVSARAAGRSGGGYWLLFLGGVFLLHSYDILPLRQSWPLFIVAGGISIMVGRDRDGRGC